MIKSKIFSINSPFRSNGLIPKCTNHYFLYVLYILTQFNHQTNLLSIYQYHYQSINMSSFKIFATTIMAVQSVRMEGDQHDCCSLFGRRSLPDVRGDANGVTHHGGRYHLPGSSSDIRFSEWLADATVQEWLRHQTDLELGPLFMVQSNGRFAARAAGWRPQAFGGAPADYQEKRAELIGRFGQAITVQVVCLNGDVHTIGPCRTVGEIIQRIPKENNQRIQLYYGDEPLNKYDSLAQYNIKENDVLACIIIPIQIPDYILAEIYERISKAKVGLAELQERFDECVATGREYSMECQGYVVHEMCGAESDVRLLEEMRDAAEGGATKGF